MKVEPSTLPTRAVGSPCLNSCSTADVSYLNEDASYLMIVLFVSDAAVSFADDLIIVREESGTVEVCVELSLHSCLRGSTTAARLSL